MSQSSFASFRVVKMACKMMGIYLYDQYSQLNTVAILINFILIIVQLALIIPSSVYLFYSTDVGDAIEVLSVLFALILNFGQYLIFVFTKFKLRLLFDNFQEMIDERKLTILNDNFLFCFILFKISFLGDQRSYFDYKKTEQKLNVYSIRFYKFVTILFVIVLGMPFYVVIFHLVMGTYDSSVWFLPYKVLCV